MSVVDYIACIKEICDSLASINVIDEEDEMVQVRLGGMASKFRALRMVICTRENTLLFFDIQSILLAEGNHKIVKVEVAPNNLPEEPRCLVWV